MSNIDLAWSRPTTRQGGLPLPANEIANFKIYMNFNGGLYALQATVPGSQLTYQVPSAPPGTHGAKIAAVDIQNQEGLQSSPVSIVVPVPPPPAPDAPTGVTIGLS